MRSWSGLLSGRLYAPFAPLVYVAVMSSLNNGLMHGNPPKTVHACVLCSLEESPEQKRKKKGNEGKQAKEK